MKSVELLAPAKNLEVAIAAINCGADAIYIGATEFGARKNAPNSLADIEALVNYAHKFYVKVHVAINTILNNNELQKAIKLIENLYNIGVDAVIIQDFGILNAAINGKLPPIQLHMSTQCDNRNLEKAKFFDDIGVSRVILARELSLEKISEICKNTKCEIETFIHGALCVSYSGQCYLSYANGGRSANRGECAQPCRMRYSLIDDKGKTIIDNKYLLSLKDFNASKYIDKLINCGVKSFKIEGRLKDINYVRNIVLYYNNLINNYAERTSSGKIFSDFEPTPKKTFNRGYTEYFLNNRCQCFNFISPKSKGEKVGKITKVADKFFEIDAKISPQDGLCYIEKGEMKGFLVNKVVGNKVYPAKMPKLIKDTVIFRNIDSVFEKQLNSTKTVRKIEVKFTLKDNKIYILDEDNNCVCKDLLIQQEPKDLNKMKQTLINQLKRTGNSDFYVSEITIEDDNIPFLPVSEINKLRREMLSLLTNERLKNYNKKLQKPIKYSTFPYKKMDYHANVLNEDAKNFYKNCNCEISEMALESKSDIPHGIELMRTKHCIKYAANLCGKKCNKLYLLDDKNNKYPLKFDCKNCEMVILSP